MFLHQLHQVLTVRAGMEWSPGQIYPGGVGVGGAETILPILIGVLTSVVETETLP